MLYLWLLLVIFILWGYFRYLGPIIITFRKDSPYAVKPTKAYGRSACWDVYASEDIYEGAIPEGQWREVPIGITFAPWPHIYIPFFNLTLTPFGNVAYKIHTRSGMAIKRGERNHLGIIDNDYRKSLTIVMFNHGIYPFRVKRGNKIAQLEFYRVPSVWMWRRNKLSKSERGERGLGSTGK